MAQIYGQLELVTFEVLSSDPSLLPQARFWFNSTSGVLKFWDGAAVKTVSTTTSPTGNVIIGLSGTAANNVKIFRAGTTLIQIVPGNDATAEGSLSTSVAQLSSRHENYTEAGKPAFGNPGRVIYTTDTKKLLWDTSSAWSEVVELTATQTLTNKTFTSPVFNTPSLTGASITDYLDFLQISTPSSPSASHNRLYFKSDGYLRTLDSSGVEIILRMNPAQDITATGSFVVPQGVTLIKVLIYGGGGGGAGANIGAGTVVIGGGGGGAALPVVTELLVVPGETLDITIGAGGTGGAAGATAGTDGGTTIITRHSSGLTLIGVFGGAGGTRGSTGAGSIGAGGAGRLIADGTGGTSVYTGNFYARGGNGRGAGLAGIAGQLNAFASGGAGGATNAEGGGGGGGAAGYGGNATNPNTGNGGNGGAAGNNGGNAPNSNTGAGGGGAGGSTTNNHSGGDGSSGFVRFSW